MKNNVRKKARNDAEEEITNITVDDMRAYLYQEKKEYETTQHFAGMDL